MTDDPQELRRELEEAQETLRAIRSGSFDALVIDTGSGDELFALSRTERSHRLVEIMAEGALADSPDPAHVRDVVISSAIKAYYVQ